MVGLVAGVGKVAFIMMPEEEEVEIDIGVEDTSVDGVAYIAEWK